MQLGLALREAGLASSAYAQTVMAKLMPSRCVVGAKAVAAASEIHDLSEHACDFPWQTTRVCRIVQRSVAQPSCDPLTYA